MEGFKLELPIVKDPAAPHPGQPDGVGRGQEAAVTWSPGLR